MRFLALLSLFSCFIRAYGQHGEVLPPQFDHYFQNYSLTHPAASGFENGFQLNLGHRGLTGDFQGVNTSYVGISYRFRRDSVKTDHHGMAVNVLNDREGYYFNRGRIYFSYAWHNKISSEWTISAGVMMGLINYVYRGSTIMAGGNSLRPTADIGLFIYNTKDLRIGLTMSQVVPGSIKPLEGELKIKRHWVATLDKDLQLSPFFSLLPALRMRFPVRSGSLDVDAYLLARIQNIFLAGLHYKHTMGYSLMCGVQNVLIGRKEISFLVSYYMPFNQGRDIKANRMEGTFKLGL